MKKADGLDSAILGVHIARGSDVEVLAYSVEKIIDILVSRDGMTNEEAYEFFSFNIEGAYVGEDTPIYIDAYIDEEEG